MALEVNRIVVQQGVNGEWYWHFQSRNGQLMAVGGEGYKNLEDIRTALLQVCDVNLPVEWTEQREKAWHRSLHRHTPVEVIIRDPEVDTA